MRKRRQGTALLMGFALALLAACAKEPTREVRSAREARQTAKAAQAAEYAPESWRAVEDAWTKLDVELHAQKELPMYSRSYERAEALAAETRAAGERAAADAATAKRTARKVAAAKTSAEAVLQTLDNRRA